MKLSTKARYGIRAVLEIAKHYGDKPIQSKAIAQNQDISIKYLEQLMSILKTSGIINSVRGARGGYMLSRSPEDIKVSEVYFALEGPSIMSVQCVDDQSACDKTADCITRQIWVNVEQAIRDVLDSVTFRDLLDKLTDNNALYYQI